MTVNGDRSVASVSILIRETSADMNCRPYHFELAHPPLGACCGQEFDFAR